MREAGVLAAVLLVLGLSACGRSLSDSRSSSTVTQTVQGNGGALSKSEFISKADAICQRYKSQEKRLQDKFTKLQRSGLSGSKLTEGADILRQSASLVEKGEQELRQLQPPPADQTIVNKWLTTGGGNIAIANQLADALEAGDSAPIRGLAEQLNSNSSKAKGIAQRYGFKVCGSA